MLTLLLNNWRIIAFILLGAALGFMIRLYDHEHTLRVSRDAVIEQAAKDAEAAKKQFEDKQATTNKEISDAWATAVPVLQSKAISNYCAKFGCGVPTCLCPAAVPAGTPVGDQNTQAPAGTEQERMAAGCAPDPGFVAACAEDALARRQLREWADKEGIEGE